MGYKSLRYTFRRSNTFYIQFRFADGKSFKRSLDTDSLRVASAIMASLIPLVPFVQDQTLALSDFTKRIDAIKSSIAGDLKSVLSFAGGKSKFEKAVKPKEVKSGLSLVKAWEMYKAAKGTKWSRGIAQANDRFMAVLFVVLGKEKDVITVNKHDIKQVMEVVENLPKRVVQPYRSMTLEQLIALEDVPEADLVGDEAMHKHLKLFKSLFKTFLTDDKGILEKSPTDGITASASKARYGAYSVSEMRKFVQWAIEQPEGWEKWIMLLLAYTGCRRAEIATLRKQQIKYDEDSKRHYLLIAEGGQGKTDNATRRVVIHLHLIEWGFLEFVAQSDDVLFPDVSGSNMTKIGKTFSDVRDQLGIPYLDDHQQRRLLHSMRHAVATTSMAGWVKNVAHLQSTLGHQMTGIGVTKRYLHSFPLSTICYVIDGLSWKN